jgi:ABC-type multidrug transport system ATPase subunit
VTVVDPVVVVDGVTKAFEGTTVLDGVELDVAENELTLLMGPNGAGKTILLSCIAGGLFPTAGEISVYGDAPADARHQHAFMLQGELALPALTGRENLAFYRDLHPRTTDRWRELTETFDLADDLDRQVRNYSGGMERKLELAISFTADVPLYLLDEPTAELDLTAINQLHRLLQDELDRGKTVLMTSHTPMDAEIADRIAFVQHGTVVAEGRPDDLLSRVPDVLRVAGGRRIGSLEAFVHDGRFFESGQDRRGFLQAGVTAEEARTAVDRAADRDRVTRESPSYADMFNYYTRVRPNES